MRYIDFNHVAKEHRAIDARLHNWARWAAVHSRAAVQPMFRYYRPDNFGDDRGSYDTDRPVPVDPQDAAVVEGAVCKLPDDRKLATIWFYRIRTKPAHACKAIGVNRDGLAWLINDARGMLRIALDVRRK